MNLRNARLASRALGGASDPVAKVLETMSGLLAKIIAEAEGVTKMYDEFAEWCEDKFKEPCFEIKLGQCEVDQLKAEFVELTAMNNECSNKMETLTGEIAVDEARLRAATDPRAKEQTAFANGGRNSSRLNSPSWHGR